MAKVLGRKWRLGTKLKVEPQGNERHERIFTNTHAHPHTHPHTHAHSHSTMTQADKVQQQRMR